MRRIHDRLPRHHHRPWVTQPQIGTPATYAAEAICRYRAVSRLVDATKRGTWPADRETFDHVDRLCNEAKRFEALAYLFGFEAELAPREAVAP